MEYSLAHQARYTGTETQRNRDATSNFVDLVPAEDHVDRKSWSLRFVDLAPAEDHIDRKSSSLHFVDLVPADVGLGGDQVDKVQTR